MRSEGGSCIEGKDKEERMEEGTREKGTRKEGKGEAVEDIFGSRKEEL